MRKAIPLFLAAVVTVSGCGGTSGMVATGKQMTGSNRPAETATATTTQQSPPPTSEAPPPVVNPKFGETFTYEDGLVVTVGAPQPFTPSEYAFVGEPAPPAFVAFDVTIVNGTQQNFDPVSFYVTMQSANVEEEQIFDSENGIEGSPSTPILPGREAVFKIAFGATNPNDLVMQVSPSFDHEPIIYTS